MIKNRDTFAAKMWWYLFLLILIEIPVVQLCKKSNENISADDNEGV